MVWKEVVGEKGNGKWEWFWIEGCGVVLLEANMFPV